MYCPPESDGEWVEVATLLTEAEGLPAGERGEFVRAKASSERVRAEVMALLAALESDGSFLERGVRLGDPLVGKLAGNCRLLRVLGQGGMGTVYEGVRSLPLGDGRRAEQRVAVKVWHAGVTRPAEAAREASLLARLEHPNIARLLDTGQLDDGRPYLVMELVEGKPLLEGAAGMGLEERLRLFRQICEGVESAHRALIVHRDLKPSNILLMAGGEPKLIDFGIGKAMDDGTTTIDPRLTPKYASPEQVRGEPLTTATDVYSLGVILEELVGGGKLPGELASVILKAKAEQPGERYLSAQALSDDLERYLKGEPVRAVEATAGYRARKFVLRHRWAVAAGVAALVLIGVGFGRAYSEARVAEERFDELRGLARALLFEIHDEVAKTPGTLESRRMIVSRALEYLDRLARSSRLDERLQMDLAESYERVGEVQGSMTVMAESFGRHGEAAKSFGKSIAIWERLEAAAPGDRRRRIALAKVAEKMAVACGASGDGGCRDKRARQSERLYGVDAAENPGDPRAQMRWLTARIEARPVVNDLRAAQEEYRAVAAAFDGLLARHPKEKEVAAFAAYAYKRLGAAEGKAGAHEEGLAQYRKALRLHEEEGNRMGESTCYVDMAWIEQERGNWKAALSSLDKAMGIRRELAKNRGADRNFKAALLSVGLRKARVLQSAGREREAELLAEALLGEAGVGVASRREAEMLAELTQIARKARLAERAQGLEVTRPSR